MCPLKQRGKSIFHPTLNELSNKCCCNIDIPLSIRLGILTIAGVFSYKNVSWINQLIIRSVCDNLAHRLEACLSIFCASFLSDTFTVCNCQSTDFKAQKLWKGRLGYQLCASSSRPTLSQFVSLSISRSKNFMQFRNERRIFIPTDHLTTLELRNPSDNVH